jgi:pimeloyl-ACP methyl ester carboxylesterase
LPRDDGVMSMTTIRLRDGRAAGLHRIAEGHARTIVLCHAAPGSGAFDPDPAETARRDVTLLAVDRPGYGASDPPRDGEPGGVGDAADDLAEVLDGLGTGPVGVAGWSAGGRVALALAARRPDLVHRVAVIATPAPHEAVPWIPEPHARMLDAMRGLPPGRAREQLAAQLGGLVPTKPAGEDALELLGRSPADDEALGRDGTAARLGTMLEADIAGYGLRSWGFEPADVAAKVLLVYGSRDPAIGQRHGSWYQRRLPDARLEMAPGAGHFVVIPRWGRALSHLAPGALTAPGA